MKGRPDLWQKRLKPIMPRGAARYFSIGSWSTQDSITDREDVGSFFQELGIPQPNINLGVGSGSHAQQTASVMCKFEEVCLSQKPDWVVVVGDVNSTMACTLVCAKMGIKVAHVEAGLRSFDRGDAGGNKPLLVTDSIADLLLTPSADGDENLKREGVPESKIKLVGNVMIDTLASNLAKAATSAILQNLGLKSKSFVYVTLHRPSKCG